MVALKSLFKIPQKAQIGFLKVDVSINENHTRTASISDNEVEDGAVISDHVKLMPKTLSMTALISNTPLAIAGLGVSTDDILGASQDFLGGDKSSFEDLAKNEKRTPQEAWKYLDDVWKKRVPFSIITTLDKYDNMIITSLSAPRNKNNGRDLEFSLSVREVRIVQTETTTIPAFKVKDDAKNSATSKKKLGKQTGKQATDAQTDDSSLLLKGFKKVGIF